MMPRNSDSILVRVAGRPGVLFEAGLGLIERRHPL